MNRRWAPLVGEPLHALRRACWFWSGGLALLIAGTVAFWPAFRGSSLSDALDAMPSGVVQALGLQAIGTPAGFLRGNLYEFFVPLLLIGAAAAMASGQLAGEEAAGRLELLLSEPVSRGAFWAGATVAVALAVGAITVAVAIAQVASDMLFDLPIATSRVVATVMLCGLLALLHAGVAVGVAGFTPRPALALGLPVAVGVAGYLAVALFPLVPVMAPWHRISPWDWAFGGDPLVQPTAAWRYVALALPAAALAALGAVGFTRRDVRAP